MDEVVAIKWLTPSETLDTGTEEAVIIYLEARSIKRAIDSSLDSTDR